jgi:hypothetical protein
MIAWPLARPSIALPISSCVVSNLAASLFGLTPVSTFRRISKARRRRACLFGYDWRLDGIFTNEYGMDSSKVTWVVDDEEHV